MTPWDKWMSAAASAVDKAFVVAIQAQTRHERAAADAMPRPEKLAELEAVAQLYGGGERAEIDDPSIFFPTPPRATLSSRVVRSGVWESTWASAFTPFRREIAERWQARVENRTARARLYLASAPDTVTTRPAMIAIHGYMGGQWMLEESHWPTDWLVRRGLDVALPLLPLHGARAGAHRGSPGFPSSDRRLTNEGFRQAVSDIRALARFLRERGASHVGVMGVSLGGYTAALLATTSDDFDFVVPMIPLVSLADFAREQGRLGEGPDADAEHAAIERAHRIASPLARPLRLPRTRALVIGAEHDRITPMSHARKLASHFACEMQILSGGHLVQLGRDAAFRGLVGLLERDKILASATR